MNLSKVIQLDHRAIVYVAIFGALWGLAEATLGAVLHLLHVPLAGAVLGAIGLSIALIARSLNHVRGTTLLMAFLAASIKMLSFSTVKLGPFIAILVEGILLEIVFSLFGNGRLAFLISALFISVYPIVQSIVTKSILFGQNFVPVILELVEGFSKRVGYQAGWWMLGIYILSHALLTFAAAGFSWKLLQQIETRQIGG